MKKRKGTNDDEPEEQALSPQHRRLVRQLTRTAEQLTQMADAVVGYAANLAPPLKLGTKTVTLACGRRVRVTCDGVPVHTGMTTWWWGSSRKDLCSGWVVGPHEFRVHRIDWHKHKVFDRERNWMPIDRLYGSIFACMKYGPTRSG